LTNVCLQKDWEFAHNFLQSNPFVKTAFSPLREYKVIKYFPSGLTDALKKSELLKTTYEREKFVTSL
jgi:hypothetical protein